MPKLIIMIGIQGSGKSTFCKNFLDYKYEYISMDVIRNRNKERARFNAAIYSGKNVVIDNTNPTKDDRKRYIPIAKAADYEIIGIFMQSILSECINRNNARSGIEKVPAKAIAATSNKLQFPEYSEGFDKLYFAKISGNTIILDDWR